MAPSTSTLELSRAEIAGLLDREALRRLGVPGEELIKLYNSGALKDCGLVSDLLAPASLLKKDDPLFVAA